MTNVLDNRSQVLLKTLIEPYITDGQPVGSRALSRQSGLDLSPATIRNVMSDLEEAGFIASPHTSAGRIPTARGYRLFVDSMLTVQPLEKATLSELKSQLKPDEPRRLIASASQLLSGLSHFAGIVVTQRKEANTIRQIEFVSLSEKRVLLIIVSSNGDVQNRLLLTQRAYTPAELVEAGNYLSHHCAGLEFADMLNRLRNELQQLRSEMSQLMTAAIHAGTEAMASDNNQYVISGERNLLEVDDLSANMDRLRDLFKLFDQRTSMLQLLDLSNRATGLQIYIGGESGLAPLDECSVITAPYEVDGKIVGTLGVIGPTRMAYERVIPIVDITARLLSSALSSNS